MSLAIRKIGWMMALDAGLTGSVSMVGRLMSGILGGLPPSAIAVSGVVSFTASSILELPTGILTDVFGRVKAVQLGYALQAAAAACMFVSFAVYPTHVELMWLFRILEALLDAFGNAFISGSREAIFQQILVKDSASLPTEERRRIHESGQMRAERHGRVFQFVTPLLSLALMFTCLYQYQFGYVIYPLG